MITSKYPLVLQSQRKPEQRMKPIVSLSRENFKEAEQADYLTERKPISKEFSAKKIDPITASKFYQSQKK